MTRFANAVVAIATLAAALSCRPRSAAKPQPVAAGALRGANVILVSIDTLRADHVGAYGSALGLTPRIDRLAADGIVFRTVYAHAPLTLPSHAAMMTGTYPLANGVHDNGAFRLGSDRHTLAASLKTVGYRTAAFVGAFVLDARFGLNAGFDVYDDRMLGTGGGLEVVQRPADQVLAAAGDWIAGASGGPFFAWIHLYDPHEPYNPPEPYASRYAADPYSGEIAYADASLASFLDRLSASGKLARTLVVITSDHGESLGEHGERTHGLFAYDATLRVPLVFWAGAALQAAAVKPLARLVDLMPTVLDLVGVEIPQSLDGSTLRPLIGASEEPADRYAYFEAMNANLTRSWAPLRGVVGGGVKLIDLPVPELYDLAADPRETRNIYASARDRARPLESRLDQIVAVAPSPSAQVAIDADAAARLRSLGYVVGAAPKPARAYTAADDPKRLVHLNAALDDAAALWSRSRPEEAIARLRQVVAERPDLLPAYDRLAFMLEATGHPDQAVQILDTAARAGHADPALLRSLGSALRAAGDLRRSASVLEAVLKQDKADAQAMDALAQTYTRMGRARDAELLFRRVVDVSPNAATTWTNLGVLYLEQRRDRDAVDAFTQAIRIDQALAGAHNGLGVAYAKLGDVDRAAEEWRRALALRPDFRDARANLEAITRR